MNPSTHRETAGALAIAERSPELVALHDKRGWLALFTPDATIEDPVGAGVHSGRAALARFWDAFIAPNHVAFQPHRDLVAGHRVVRDVTIATRTPVSVEPFELPAILEYRIAGERIASMRAYWDPRRAIGWHARHGVRGVAGLARHGARMTSLLGIGSSIAFGRALFPRISRAEAERVARALASRPDWLRAVGRARLTIDGRWIADPAGAWERLHDRLPDPRVERLIRAGDRVACVLAAPDRAIALLARIAAGEVVELAIVGPVG